MARIFARDQVDFFEHANSAQRYVFEISDWSCNNVECARHHETVGREYIVLGSSSEEVKPAFREEIEELACSSLYQIWGHARTPNTVVMISLKR